MNSNNSSEYTIENFRAEILVQFSTKGVIPPSPGSEEEQKLFQQWQTGKKNIENLKYVP